MKLVSILGLVALLGIAWAISYRRRDVGVRTVAWGLGLQLLFAVIILREDAWSFAGMAVFAALLVAYMASHSPLHDGGPGAVAVWVAAAAVLGLLATTLLAPALPWLLVLLVVLLVANVRSFRVGGLGSLGGVAFVTLGVAFLVSRGLTGQEIFAAFSDRVAGFLNLSDYGASFLFGDLADPAAGFGALFAFKVLPTIIFFGAFMSVLYHLGVIQKVIEGMSHFLRWTIGTSGAETLSCSANVFVGQTEAPLLIKPFLPGMTRSELLTIMVGGFATIAGGVLAGYIAMGVPAGHLVAASVMSAPAALVMGKLIYPETEHSETAGDIEIPPVDTGSNVIEAASNGIADGLKLAVNVGAMLIGFIALIAVVDVTLNWLDGFVDGRWLRGEYREYLTAGLSPATGEHEGIFPGSLRTLFGTVLGPLAFLMGVPWADAVQVGNLLGIKLSLNEFVAYGTLGTYIQEGTLSPRSIVIATYALCGFANFASIGIQIGGISAIAPSRKSDLAQVGLRAMIGGALASWSTATIAGMLVE